MQQSSQDTVKSASSQKWKFWLAIGIGAVLGGAYIYHKMKNRHPDDAKISELKALIDQSFSLVQSSLCPLTKQKTKQIKDDNITMEIHYISKLQNKNKSNLSATRNPFLPPFEKGIMITELPPRHRLLYNKFYFFKNHLLVVTQEFESQNNRITLQDFKQTLLVMYAVNGIFFFNSGPQSGFSQPHKHIQILPNDAMKLPILKQLLNQLSTPAVQPIPYKSRQDVQIYHYSNFQFIHALVLFPQKLGQEHLEQCAIQYKKAEDVLYSYLAKVLGFQQSENAGISNSKLGQSGRNVSKFSYNVIGCKRFLIMIPRKGEKACGEVGVNAICFMGSMLIKDQKIFEKIQYLCKPSQILKDLTFTEVPKLKK